MQAANRSFFSKVASSMINTQINPDCDIFLTVVQPLK